MAEPKSKKPPALPPPAARLLPWHEPLADQLRQAWSADRIAHALLLHGAEGIGKRDFAAWLAAAVLCDSSRNGKLDFCRACASCALIAAGSHPDLLWVRPEEDKQQIAIDQLRAASERLSKTSYREGPKVAIIEPAHQMTPSAANSLLKTLEEPPLGSLLILVSSRASALLPTVRSRCQKFSMDRPNPVGALAWAQEESGRALHGDLLEFAGFAPLRALAQADGSFDALNDQMQDSLGALLAGRADLTQVAAAWADERLPDRLTWLDLWLLSLARGALTGNADLVTFPRRPVHLPSPAHALNISAVYNMVDRARALKAQLARTALQRELAVESWLIALLDLLAPAAASSSRGASNSRSA